MVQMLMRRPRSLALPSTNRTFVLLGASLSLMFLPMPRADGRQITANTARTQKLTVVAHLHYVTARGAYLIEEGSASGPLSGTIRARVRVAADITGTFTFYPRGGSVSGYGTATLHESGAYASFGGSLKVLGGTGRYAHARGGGRLYGVYDRRGPHLALTIQTTGSFSY